MSKVLDFTKQTKSYLTVKLNDEKKTALMIGTPTRGIFNEFIMINEKVSDDGGADADTINDLYEVCAKVMSFNKGGIKITADYLSEECNFDLEDIMLFFRAYSDHMASVTNAKN